MVAFFALDESRPLLYQGGFLLVALATAVLIAAVAHPSSRISARLLGHPVMRWLGTRSYGIYLWHWPLFMVTRPHSDVPLDGLDLAALRFAATFALAEASYRFVRGPVRRADLAAWWHAVRTAATARGWAIRAASLSGSVATVVLVTVVARAHAPEPPPYLQVTEFHGIVGPSNAGAIAATQPPALLAPEQTPTLAPTTDPGSPPAESAGTEPPASAPATTAPPPTPAKPLTPVYIQADVLAIGDSVMIGAADELGRAGTVDIDAVVGRQASAIVAVIDAHRAAGPLPPVVVIHTGDNGPFTRGQFDSIVADLAGVRQIIFVNDKVDRPWEGSNNAMLASAAGAYQNVTLVDWHDASSGHPEYFWDDGLHLRPEGANAYARVIANAILPPPPPPPPPAPPTATPTATPSPSPSASPSPSVSPSPSATPSGTATPKLATVTSTPSATATPTGAVEASTPSPSPSASPSASPSPTP